MAHTSVATETHKQCPGTDKEGPGSGVSSTHPAIPFLDNPLFSGWRKKDVLLRRENKDILRKGRGNMELWKNENIQGKLLSPHFLEVLWE